MGIREAHAGDLDALEALEGRCFPEDPWTRPMLAEELSRPGGIVLVGEDAGQAWGFIIGLRVMDRLEVLQVGVDPARRGEGLGAQLLSAFEVAAPRVEEVLLEVRTTNHAAIRLYARAGYTAIATRRGYYRDGTDALVLRKALRS